MCLWQATLKPSRYLVDDVDIQEKKIWSCKDKIKQEHGM